MTRRRRQVSEEDEVYAAMCILKERWDEHNSVMYLVQWAGHDQNGNPWEPTWEPYENCGTILIQEWEEKRRKEREKDNGEPRNPEQNNTNAPIVNEGKNDIVEKNDDVCQSRQINGINGKKKKLHQLHDTPTTTGDKNASVGRGIFCDDVNQPNDAISESSQSPSSKRIVHRKNSMKGVDLDNNRKRSVSLKSRQVKLFKSLSNNGKLSVNSSRRVPDSSNDSLSSSDSEHEIHHHMNGNGAIQFYKYPLRSRSGRLSITRRLECSSISKRKVSPRSFDGRITDDLDSRKKLRYDEDSYSSEEEILCSGQVFPCGQITPITSHSPKYDDDIEDLYAPPITKTTNIKNVDKLVSNSTPQTTISHSTNVNMNGSHEHAQKSSNGFDLGTTAANDANSSSKRPIDHHHSIQNIRTSIATSTNQCVNINVNTQSSESLLLIAPKPVQTVRNDVNLRTTQRRTQTKARKPPLKTDAVKNVSQLTVNSSNPPILPKPPTSSNIVPIIRPTSLMNNNTNMRSVQNRTIRPNSDLYSNPIRPNNDIYSNQIRPNGDLYSNPIRPNGDLYSNQIRPNNELYSNSILPDDNYNKVTLKDGQGSATLADHGHQSRNMLHAPLTTHRSLGVSQPNPLGVGVNNLQLDNSVATTNTTNCNAAPNLRNKTNIPSYQEIHSASENRYMKSELIEQRKTIERQTEQLSKAHKALAEKTEECEHLKNTISNMTTNESLKQENESLKRENEMLKMYFAKVIQDGGTIIQRDYDKLSTMCTSIQNLSNQHDIVVNHLQRAESTSTSSNSSESHSQLRSKLNQSQLKVSLLEKSLQMKDENEKIYQQAARLVLDLRLEPLKNYMELQNSVKALIPSSILEASRMSTEHNATRRDTSINISTTKTSNDKFSSNINTSNNINAQTDNSPFNTSNNYNSARSMDIVRSVNGTSKGVMKTKDSTDANFIKPTNGTVTKSKDVVSIPTVSTFADNTSISNVFTRSSETPESTLNPDNKSTSIASISKSLVTPTKSTPKINGGPSTRFTAIMNSHSALPYPISQNVTSNTSPNKATNGMLNASAKSQYS
ncbi:13155_t:CDS:2, partial [Dentiscutata heterogama]